MSGIVGSFFNHRGSGIVAKLGTDGHTFNSGGAGKKAVTEAVVVVADGVDGSKIADDAVDSEHYTDGSIDNAHIADDAIDSEHYAAGSIDNAHLADDAVDSDELAAGAVDTAHIADNQVTLAKMAGLARGKLIYGDSSGDPAALAVGSADQVLTHDGTDVSWEDASAGATLSGSTDNTVVTVTGSNAMQGEAALTFDGTTLTIPGRIAFPATQSDTSAANTLDDYEEGDWTPQISINGSTSGITHATDGSNAGRYTKIGRLVLASASCILTDKGSSSGSVTINLPFSPNAFVLNHDHSQGGFSSRISNLGSNKSNVVFRIRSDAAEAYLQGASSFTTSPMNGYMNEGDMADNTNIAAHFIYQASA